MVTTTYANTYRLTTTERNTKTNTEATKTVYASNVRKLRKLAHDMLDGAADGHYEIKRVLDTLGHYRSKAGGIVRDGVWTFEY